MSADAGIQADPRRPRLRPTAVLCAAALVGLSIGVGLHFVLAGEGSAPSGVATQAASSTGLHGQASWRADVRPAPAIRMLRDQNGQAFSLASLRGRTVAMTFFDSHCTQACPLEGRALAAAERSLPVSQRPVLVVVSVNPRDTPASARAAAKKWGIAQVGPWHWLMGTHAELAGAWRSYHISVAPPRDGDIAHTEALYLIDRRGDERSGYLYPFVPRSVTLDLRTLADERES